MPQMALDRKSWGFGVAFFLGCPLLLALPLGLFQAGFGQYLPLEISVLFWVCAWFSSWWVSELFLRLWHGFLQPWHTPLTAEIILANVTTIVAYAFYFPPVMYFFAQYSSSLPAGFFDRPFDRGSIEHVVAVARSGLSGLVAWTLLRSLYAMVPGVAQQTSIKRDKGQDAAKSSPAIKGVTEPVEPKIARFQRELGSHGVRDLSEVAALQASDHYVNVHLYSGRKIFILARFSDAIDAVAGQDGLRVHRSFWISRKAIARVDQDGPALAVHLSNGLECRVSTKYLGLFEHFLATA